MTQTNITVSKARENLAEILGRVKFGHEVVTIEKQGKPFAVIISPDQYEAFRRNARLRLGEIAGEIHALNTQYSAEEVMKDVTNAVEDIRRKRYERSTQNTT